MSWVQLLLVVSILWPWWMCGATVIGTCCCLPATPACCVAPCQEYATAGVTWPCYWQLSDNTFQPDPDPCNIFNGSNEIGQTIFPLVTNNCEWTHSSGVFLRFDSGIVKLLFRSGIDTCALYTKSQASWNYCGANVMTLQATPNDCGCSSRPATITVTPLAVGSDPDCNCHGVTQCPLLNLPNTLHATASDIGAGNSCFATPQSVAIVWDGTIWDSGTVTMTGCGGTRTVRVTCDTAGAIRLWCDGVEFSLGSTTTTSCDPVTFEIRRESVVAQPGNCCSSGNCSIRVAVML